VPLDHNRNRREVPLAYESGGAVATRNSEGDLLARTVGATDLGSVSRLVKFACRERKRPLVVVTVLTVSPLDLVTHYCTAERPCRTADRGALTASG
jgi:hypothetical protein